jgi:hypothetical protein
MPYPMAAARGKIQNIQVSAVDYIAKVLGIGAANMLAYWPLNETSGATADNAQGTAARDAAYTGVTLSDTIGPDGDNGAPLFDAVSDYVNVFTASLQGTFNGNEGTLACWLKVANAGVWGGTGTPHVVHFRVNGNNFIRIYISAANTLTFERVAAAGSKSVAHISSDTAWMHVALTWSDAGDALKAYVNGVQIGSTQTSLNTFAGSIGSANSVVGAFSVTPASVWNGWLAHSAIWNTPLSDASIAALADTESA